MDVAALFRRHADRVTLSPIDSGVTFARVPARTEHLPHSRDSGEKPVEITADYTVPDVSDLTLPVSRWHGAEKLEEIWRCPAR